MPSVMTWLSSTSRRSAATALDDMGPERVPRDEEPALDELVAALEAAVLVLDADPAVVAHGVEGGQEAVPAHLAQAGQARRLPAHAGAQHAVLVEPVAVDLHVLGVDVEDPVGEVVDDALVVD